MDLSRKELDVGLLSGHAGVVEGSPRRRTPTGWVAWPPRRRAWDARPRRHRVDDGARFVHDTLEELGWDVLIADAAKVKGLAPLECKTDKIDARVVVVLSHRDLVPAIWLPDPRVRREREQARFRMHLVGHRSILKHRSFPSML